MVQQYQTHLQTTFRHENNSSVPKKEKQTVASFPRWKNCYADVVSGGYPRIAQSFLNEIIEPSLAKLDEQIKTWAATDDPWAPFALADTEELLRATTMAFCLSVQSMWERQIRAYLISCIQHLKAGASLQKRAMHDEWKELDHLFVELRGISLTKFDSYKQLNLLQLLGNACRHGDGVSAEKLWKLRPDLWPHFLNSNSSNIGGKPPPVQDIIIPRDLIQSFVRAIISFWNDTECIYLESIERKHPSVEKKLVRLRQDRADWIARLKKNNLMEIDTARD